MSKPGLECQAKWGWAFSPGLGCQQEGVPGASRTTPSSPSLYKEASSWMWWGLNASPSPQGGDTGGGRAVCS